MRISYRQRALEAEAAAERELAAVPDFIWDGREVPVPIDTIADSHYGLLVREEDRLAALAGLPGGHVSGMLIPPTREIWVDGVEAHLAPVRRRFTIGHEVGHWVLHCDSGCGAAPGAPPYCRSEAVIDEGEPGEDEAEAEQRIARFTPYPMPEHEANHFGAALLMPREVVAEERQWSGGDVSRMARHFGVSLRAMELRIRHLGRIEEDEMSVTRIVCEKKEDGAVLEVFEYDNTSPTTYLVRNYPEHGWRAETVISTDGRTIRRDPPSPLPQYAASKMLRILNER